MSQVPSVFGLRDFVADAQAQTGLTVRPDASYYGPMEVLLDSIEREAGFGEERAREVRTELLSRLCSRLQLDDHIDRHPEITSQPVVRPIFIVGFARSGTTLLHELMAQDPASRAPRYWEVMYPMPPVHGEVAADDPRLARAGAEIELLLERAPAIASQHPYYVTDGPRMIAECVHMFMLNLSSAAYTGFYNVPTYQRWYDRYDFRLGYPFHRRFLQFLQAGRLDEQWVLKDPVALSHLSALHEAYPDAQFVWNHRDVLTMLSSVVSHIKTFRGIDGAADLAAVVERQMSNQLQAIESVTSYRDGSPEAASAFVDVDYVSLTKDPLGVVEALYDQLGRPFTSEFRHGIEAWLVRNPQDRHGVHEHDPRSLGIDPDHVARTFQSYHERYGVRQ